MRGPRFLGQVVSDFLTWTEGGSQVNRTLRESLPTGDLEKGRAQQHKLTVAVRGLSTNPPQELLPHSRVLPNAPQAPELSWLLV